MACVVCVLPLHSWGPQIRSVCGESQKQKTRTHTTGIYSFLNWSQHGSVCPFHVYCMHEKEIYILRPNYFTMCRCESLLNQNTFVCFCPNIFQKWKIFIVYSLFKPCMTFFLPRKKKKVYIFINYWLLLYIMKVNRNCGCKALKWQEKLPYPYKIFQALVIIWSLDTQEPMSLGTSTIYVVLTVWLL